MVNAEASLQIDRRIDSGGIDRFATDDDHHEYRHGKTIALRQPNTGSPRIQVSGIEHTAHARAHPHPKVDELKTRQEPLIGG